MRSGGFVALVLAIALGGYAALLAAGRSPLYCTHSKSFFDTAPCFQPETTGVSTDTLLVGDSSLLYGIRPDLVAQAGGGSSWNLGMVGPSFSYLAPWLIDRYLRQNGKPKAIILYFAPWDVIADDRIVDPQWAPAAIALLRHGTLMEFARLVRHRPATIVELPPLLASGIGLGRGRADEDLAALKRQRGYLDYAARSKTPLAADCIPGSLKAPAYPPAADNQAALRALKARYAARGIKVFVYVAPFAKCDGHLDAVRRAYAGVADVAPVELDNRFFAADTPLSNHVHASGEGVGVLSARLATFIRTTVQPQIGGRP